MFGGAEEGGDDIEALSLTEPQESVMAWIPAELDMESAKRVLGELLFNEDEFRRFAYYSPVTHRPVVDRTLLMHMVGAQLLFEIDESHFSAMAAQRSLHDGATEGSSRALSINVSSAHEMKDVIVELLFHPSKFNMFQQQHDEMSFQFSHSRSGPSPQQAQQTHETRLPPRAFFPATNETPPDARNGGGGELRAECS